MKVRPGDKEVGDGGALLLVTKKDLRDLIGTEVLVPSHRRASVEHRLDPVVVNDQMHSM